MNLARLLVTCQPDALAPSTHATPSGEVVAALRLVNEAALGLVEAVFPDGTGDPRLRDSGRWIEVLGTALDALDAKANQDHAPLPADKVPADVAVLWQIADVSKAFLGQARQFVAAERKGWPGKHWHRAAVGSLRELNRLLTATP